MEKQAHEDYVWDELAIKNDWKCAWCGQYIRKTDEVIYYLTKNCGACNRLLEKVENDV